jgi:hypothetical protein
VWLDLFAEYNPGEVFLTFGLICSLGVVVWAMIDTGEDPEDND